MIFTSVVVYKPVILKNKVEKVNYISLRFAQRNAMAKVSANFALVTNKHKLPCNVGKFQEPQKMKNITNRSEAPLSFYFSQAERYDKQCDDNAE